LTSPLDAFLRERIFAPLEMRLNDPARAGEVGTRGMISWAGSTNTRYWIDRENAAIGIYLSQVQPFPYLDLMNMVMRLGVQAVD